MYPTALSKRYLHWNTQFYFEHLQKILSENAATQIAKNLIEKFSRISYVTFWYQRTHLWGQKSNYGWNHKTLQSRPVLHETQLGVLDSPSWDVPYRETISTATLGPLEVLGSKLRTLLRRVEKRCIYLMNIQGILSLVIMYTRAAFTEH